MKQEEIWNCGWALWLALCLAMVGLMGCIDDTVIERESDDGGASRALSCVVDGVEYPEGAQVPVGGGCNSCLCLGGELTDCTLADCSSECSCVSLSEMLISEQD